MRFARLVAAACTVPASPNCGPCCKARSYSFGKMLRSVRSASGCATKNCSNILDRVLKMKTTARNIAATESPALGFRASSLLWAAGLSL